MKEERNNDEKLEAPEIRIVEESKFLSRLSNFWYYHKWKVIVICFFAIIFAVGIFQMINKVDSDEIVIVAAPVNISSEESQKLSEVLNSLMPKKDSGEASKLDIYFYSIYSEDEMKNANESETDEDGKYVQYVNQSYNTSKIQEYDQFLTTGQCSVMFVSPYLYERLTANGRVRPLSDLYGKDMPVGATKDGFGVRLGDMGLYKHFSEFQTLPEDTVVVLLRQYVHGASSDDEKYADSEELFKNIVAFGQK